LKREKAQSGAITASLIWNDPADLDLYAYVKVKGGKNTETICWHDKKRAGGHLDVDMNVATKGKGFSLEPVENIYFEKPYGGEYRIAVNIACTNTDPKRWTRPEWQKEDRKVPFKVFLNREGKMQTFSGSIKDSGKEVTCFKFKVDGEGYGSGGAGNYLVFPPESSTTTFKDLCSKHKISWKIGSGYYAVARTEKIQSYKEMLLQDTKANKFTVGQTACRKKLGWPDGELKKAPKDILADHRLFVQSTSANRVIPPGTHVLFEVSPEEYAKHRKVSAGQLAQGQSAAGKAKASAKSKAMPKGKAKAEAKAKASAKAAGRAASPTAKAGAKRAASPSAAQPKAKAAARGGLSGKKIAFTGTLATVRSVATNAAKNAGATVLGGVSSNTDILVAGPGAGSKLTIAQNLGIDIWDEPKFKRAAGL